MRAAAGNARIVAGQDDLTGEPNLTHAAKPGLVYLHSGGGSPLATLDNPGLNAQVRALVDDLGFVLGGTVVGNQFWGDSTSQTRARSVRTYLQSTMGAAAGAVGVISTSQGAATALNWAASHRDEVAFVIALIGIFDLDDVRNNDRNSARALIDAAWGVTYPAALPANANPALRTTELSGLPFLGYYATNDAYDPSGTAMQAFATAIGGTATPVGALGHTDAAVAAADTQTIRAFAKAHI